MTAAKKPHTHTAYAFQRMGRKSGRMLESGTGWIDHDRNVAHVFANRQPIGGYTGYTMLLPHGVKPEAQPERPDDSDDDSDSDGEET